jgi:hypothetical protein
LAFDLVVGDTLKKIAAWKLERGATVGFLEQLTGSLSVSATVVTHLFFRPNKILAVLLLGLWSLFLLGSQSYLTTLGTSKVLRTFGTRVSLTYFNTDVEPVLSYTSNAIVAWNAMFGSTLISPAAIRNSTVDSWGNVKVPDLSRPNTYSSALGIPVNGVPKEGNITFQIETSLMAVNCDMNITHLAVVDHDFAKVWVFPVFADDSNSNITPVNGSFFSLSGSDGHPQSPFYLNSSSTLCTFDLAINQFYENPLGALTDFTDDTGTYKWSLFCFNPTPLPAAQWRTALSQPPMSIQQCSARLVPVPSQPANPLH